MNLLKGSWFLKFVALFFAIATYFYVHAEIQSAEKDKAPDPSYKLIKLTSKSLPVKVRLVTDSPEGYRILLDQVISDPPNIVVVGPEALLEEASSAETALIDVSQSMQTVTKRVPIESVAGIHLAGDSYNVEVRIPIEKVEVKSA